LAQNIYDDPAFFAGYSQIARSRLGLPGAPEWPEVAAMLPALAGLRVLDLGCGFGAFCRHAVENGARQVVGVDLSRNMLETARERSGAMPIRYVEADLESYEPEPGAFDLVYSTLAVHYLADFDAFCAKVRRALGDRGWFVMTTEHPVFATRVGDGFFAGPDGEPAYAIRDYNIEGPRQTDWIAKGVIKHHRKISTMIMTMRRHGLELYAIDEWAPSRALVEADPRFAKELMRAQLLLMAASVAPDTKIN
jgi:SAM-dependent methyltransferase